MIETERWAWRPVGRGAALAALLGGLVGAAGCDGRSSEEREAVAAAEAALRARFAAPDQVEISNVSIGAARNPFEVVVCGVADSEEVTQAGRFIFRWESSGIGFTAPDGEEVHRPDQLFLEFPPRVETHGPADEAYWEHVTRELPGFERQWREACTAGNSERSG